MPKAQVDPKREKFSKLIKQDIDPKPKLKRGVLFPRNRHPDGGFVLSKEDAVNCGWFDMNQEWEQHILDSGEKISALILMQIRVCVVASTPNYVEDRDNGDYLGIVDWENYLHDPETAKICQNYLQLLVDENYQPLHKRALHYKAHGNAGLSFTQAFVGSNEKRGFYQELDSCLREYCVQENISFEEGDVYKTHFNSVDRVEAPYHNCSVINLIFHAEKRGKEANKQSFCCLVKDWQHPTVDNFDVMWREELKPVETQMLQEANGWSRRMLKTPTFAILPYTEALTDLKSAAPPETPY